MSERRRGFAVEKGLNELAIRALVVIGVVGGDVAVEVAGEVALLEHLAAAERAAGDIPGETEQADALLATDGRPLEEAADVVHQRG